MTVAIVLLKVAPAQQLILITSVYHNVTTLLASLEIETADSIITQDAKSAGSKKSEKSILFLDKEIAKILSFMITSNKLKFAATWL